MSTPEIINKNWENIEVVYDYVSLLGWLDE